MPDSLPSAAHSDHDHSVDQMLAGLVGSTPPTSDLAPGARPVPSPAPPATTDEAECNTPPPEVVPAAPVRREQAVADADAGAATSTKTARALPTVAREAHLTRTPFLPLMADKLATDTDERASAFAAASAIRPGQVAFVRVSARWWPDYHRRSGAYLEALRRGRTPRGRPLPRPVAVALAAVTWLLRRFWWEAHGRTTKAKAPGVRGRTELLKPGERSEEHKVVMGEVARKSAHAAHYEVALRVGVAGDAADAHHAEGIVASVSDALTQAYPSPHQSLRWRTVDGAWATTGHMGAARPHTPRLALSAHELGHLARVPDDTCRPHGVRVNRSQFRSLPMATPVRVDDPLQPPPGVIPIGIQNPGGDDAQVIGLHNSQLDTHCFFTGMTGTGKSVFMTRLAFGIARAGDALIVVDPHGALCDDILTALIRHVPERIDDIVLCDLADRDYAVGLNPLDVDNVEEIAGAVTAVQRLVAQLAGITAEGAPRATTLLKVVLRALCEANLLLQAEPEHRFNLRHVTPFFTDERFRRLVVGKLPDSPSVQTYFSPDTGQFEMLTDKAKAEQIQPIVRALNDLGDHRVFAAVFAASRNRVDFPALIADRKIVLMRMAALSSQKELGEAIGTMVIPQLLGSIERWGRSKDPLTGAVKPGGCRTLVDEAGVLFGSDQTVARVLAEGRKANFGMVFASQHPEQFPPDVRAEAMANTKAKMSFRVDPKSANTMAEVIDPLGGVRSADIATVPNYHFYGTAMLPAPGGGARESGPFSAQGLPDFPRPTAEEVPALRAQIQDVVDRSRLLLSQPADVARDGFQDRFERAQVALSHVP